MIRFHRKKFFYAMWAAILLPLFAAPNRLVGASPPTKISLQYQAFAPNAGGQTVYGLRWFKDNRELTLFQNNYLTAGDAPLAGGLYSWRFPACDTSCFIHLHAQAGLGITTAGPATELLWGGELPLLPLALNGGTIKYVPMLRLDFASHWIFTTQRMINWSYPFWLGLTVPF